MACRAPTQHDVARTRTGKASGSHANRRLALRGGGKAPGRDLPVGTRKDEERECAGLVQLLSGIAGAAAIRIQVASFLVQSNKES